MSLDALEVVERLKTRDAPVVRLARRGTEFAHALSAGATTARATNHRSAKQVPRTRDRVRGGRDAEGFQLATTALGQPVASPGRRQGFFDDGAFIPCLIERVSNRAADHFRRGAT